MSIKNNHSHAATNNATLNHHSPIYSSVPLGTTKQALGHNRNAYSSASNANNNNGSKLPISNSSSNYALNRPQNSINGQKIHGSHNNVTNSAANQAILNAKRNSSSSQSKKPANSTAYLGNNNINNSKQSSQTSKSGGKTAHSNQQTSFNKTASYLYTTNAKNNGGLNSYQQFGIFGPTVTLTDTTQKISPELGSITSINENQTNPFETIISASTINPYHNVASAAQYLHSFGKN